MPLFEYETNPCNEVVMSDEIRVEPYRRTIGGTWATLRSRDTEPVELQTIPKELVSKLYQLAMIEDGCMLTGSVAMGVDREGSDVDFLIKQEVLESLDTGDITFDEPNANYGLSETEGHKFNQEEEGKPIINVIVTTTSKAWEKWEYATNMCIAVRQVDYNSIKFKQTRIALFDTFLNVKGTEIYHRPEEKSKREAEEREREERYRVVREQARRRTAQAQELRIQAQQSRMATLASMYGASTGRVATMRGFNLVDEEEDE